MTEDLSAKDTRLIWHPFTQQKTSPPPIHIVRGENTLLFDVHGKSYIDAVSSWWVNLHGHANPYIAEKVSRQLTILEHVIFAGFTHTPAVELAERLLSHLPHQQRLFFTDDGSTAVEVGLKMALQYWRNQGQPRQKVIAFEEAYHGDTFGSMSVSGRNVFTAPFDPLLFEVKFIPLPLPGKEQQALDQLNALIKSQDTAVFIFEPLVQGSAGMRMYQADVLDDMVRLCQREEVLTIADEVMTGFGRTGHWFATDTLRHKPDIVCLSKGLTGGTMPMGVTTCNSRIFDAFYSDDKTKTLFHGHSYTANPLACTAGLASLDLLEKPECQERIQEIVRQHQAFVQRIGPHPRIRDIRQQGVILAIEISTESETSYLNTIRDQLYAFFLEKGVLLRPLGNVVYILPPYCITATELDYVYQVIEEALATVGIDS
ncbi:MAG: adenosylmethionine--8-amino-7-oxononanoate transaminase [SAR324 cluster bacterium]|nr:adenosylmethionine--8-amino-7-oxononanoate transaminase [SAR324 cluster bacterium]